MAWVPVGDALETSGVAGTRDAPLTRAPSRNARVSDTGDRGQRRTRGYGTPALGGSPEHTLALGSRGPDRMASEGPQLLTERSALEEVSEGGNCQSEDQTTRHYSRPPDEGTRGDSSNHHDVAHR